MILSPQQTAALDHLLPVARIATSGIRSGLPVLPRTHSILIGPSGSGKSHLAKNIGNELGLPTLVVNVATWIIMASRSEPWTVTTIVDWLDRLPEGGILVLDEIDKLSGNSEWNRYVRLEVHDILDGVIPAAASIPAGCLPPEAIPDYRNILAKKLRERIMVVGCGAWQHAWRTNSKTLGFRNGSESFLPKPPSKEQILEAIDPELRQRFRDGLTYLPPMLSDDFKKVARSIAKKIPPELKPKLNQELGAAIRQAVDGSLGMRALEELLLKAMLLSGNGKEPETKPSQQALRPRRQDPDPFPFI